MFALQCRLCMLSLNKISLILILPLPVFEFIMTLLFTRNKLKLNQEINISITSESTTWW